MERMAAEADRAQSRFLGHGLSGRFRQRSPEQLEAARMDMEHAQVRPEHPPALVSRSGACARGPAWLT